MTLVLTEASRHGIVMVADSAIGEFRGGKLTKIVNNGRKIVPAPAARAAVSYWGFIGEVTKKQFDLWLEEKISSISPTKVSELAHGLQDAMNAAAGNMSTARLAELEQQREQLVTATNAARAELEVHRDRVLDPGHVRAGLEQFSAAWDHVSVGEKKELLGLLLHRMEVHPDKLVLVLADGRDLSRPPPRRAPPEWERAWRTAGSQSGKARVRNSTVAARSKRSRGSGSKRDRGLRGWNPAEFADLSQLVHGSTHRGGQGGHCGEQPSTGACAPDVPLAGIGRRVVREHRSWLVVRATPGIRVSDLRLKGPVPWELREFRKRHALCPASEERRLIRRLA